MNVLMIDDEPLALDLLEAQLMKLRHHAKVYKRTTLDIHNDKDLLDSIDLLLLDIEMPYINGLELATMIAEFYPQLPIVFVTGFNEYAVQAFEMNALDYLLKPVQAERLQQTLDRMPFAAKIDDHKQPLQIKMCHEFQVKTNEEQYMYLKWRTKKAQEIFIYLLHNRDKIVTKDELIDLFWEDTPLDKTHAQLYTTIYYIRKNIGPYHMYMSIKSEQNGYILRTKNVLIDLVEWERQLKQAPDIQTDTLAQHEEIMALYTGGYLEAYYYTWTENERFRLEQLWMRHAKKMAMQYHLDYKLEKAIQWFNKVTNAQPADEQANFTMMRIYAELDYGLLVNHQYEYMLWALNELDVSVEPKIHQWYEKWKKERAGNTLKT